ncbi:hypothetical protein Tco_0221753 [Tanacetum coccineum]
MSELVYCSENRLPILERGSYIPWESRFRRYLNRERDNRKWLLKALDEGPYEFKNFVPEGLTIPRLQTVEDLEGDDLLLYDAEMELMNMILLSIPNEIYNSVDTCTSAKDMWKRVERTTQVSSRLLLKALNEGPYEFKNFLPEGSTIPRLQTVEDLKGDDLLLYDAECEMAAL